MEQNLPQNEQSPHIANIGRMIEDMELKLRSTLENIYFGKTRDVVNGLRLVSGASAMAQRASLAADITSSLAQKEPSID